MTYQEALLNTQENCHLVTEETIRKYKAEYPKRCSEEYREFISRNYDAISAKLTSETIDILHKYRHEAPSIDEKVKLMLEQNKKNALTVVIALWQNTEH